MPRTTVKFRRGLAAVVAAAGAFALVAAGPASAETQSHKDKVNDVGQVGSPDGRAAAETAAEKTVDMRKYKNTYAGNSVTLRTTLVKRNNNVGYGWFMQWRLRDGRDETYVGIGPQDGPGGGYTLDYSGAGAEEECEGLKGHVRGDKVTLVVPRRCVGNAPSLRIANVTFLNTPTTSGPYFDDANTGRKKTFVFAAPLRHG